MADGMAGGSGLAAGGPGGVKYTDPTQRAKFDPFNMGTNYGTTGQGFNESGGYQSSYDQTGIPSPQPGGPGQQGGQQGGQQQSPFDGGGYSGGAIDPSKANDQNYWRQVMQYTAQQSGKPYDPSAEAYWFPKFQQSGGISDYWVSRLMMPDTGGAGGGGGAAQGGGAAGGAAQQVFNPQGLNFGATNVLGNQLQGPGGQLYGDIQSQIQQAENPVTPQDPIIKAQTDAYRAEQDRAARSALSQAAESQGPNANLSAVQRSLAEQGAQATGSMQANLMSQELGARRQMLQNLLQQGAGVMTSQQQMAIQDELAKLQLAEQESQYSRGLAEQGLEFGAGLDARYAGV